MRNNNLIILVMTLLLIAVISINISVMREIIVFLYLSFVPGFAILKVLKLKELNPLTIFLLSVGLSLTALMFVGLLVNEVYVVLGFSQPLSIIPLTTAISTFTLIMFLIGYKQDSSINSAYLTELFSAIRSHLPLAFVLTILPVLSIVGALYINIPIMIILCTIICILCVLTAASDRIIPSKFFPFLIFSVSISDLELYIL